MTKYRETLDEMIAVAGIGKKPAYAPNEVQKLLGIGDHHFRRICDQYEGADVVNGSGVGLECQWIGKHRRVTYPALVDYLMRTNGYDRECG